MTSGIIITICTLLLLAYVFDITSAKTKIPSVILLLISGWLVRQVTDYLQLPVPDLNGILPILGTIGLILIVLEGSLDLEVTKDKLNIINKAVWMSILPFFLFSILLGMAFQHFGNVHFKVAMANAIPYAVISSAIAIPSVKNLSGRIREFITYESSFSDIIGVVVFYFIVLNHQFGFETYLGFFLQIVLMLVISFVSTLLLSYLMSIVKHKVKFAPIIILTILIYSISKVYHLPSLIFVLLFGLFLGNLKSLTRLKLVNRMNYGVLSREILKFHDITLEMTFLIRALFFLLFGFLIETQEILNPSTFLWAFAISTAIFLIRLAFLKIFGFKSHPYLFVAPRGLITILLFLSLPETHYVYLSDRSLLIQVIILSVLFMMIGLMIFKDKKESVDVISPDTEEEIPLEILTHKIEPKSIGEMNTGLPDPESSTEL